MQRSCTWMVVALLCSTSLVAVTAHAQLCEPHWNDEFKHGTLHDLVTAIATFDDGTGESVYVGGIFDNAIGVPVTDIRRWDGTGWQTLGDGVDGFVNAMVVFDDGSGPALFVGGRFAHAGGLAANNIAKWDGAKWSSLAGGVAPGGSASLVWALEVFDDGSGPALFVGGQFTSAGGVLVNDIARWDGRSWTALQDGLTPLSPVYPSVLDMRAFDDGDGPALYVGGIFTDASGCGANNFARWRNGEWSDPGPGIGEIGETNHVGAMAVYDDGDGSALYLAGGFAGHLLKWDGTSFTTVQGLEDPYNDSMFARTLVVFNDGSGSGDELYLGGEHFVAAGQPTTRNLAKWNGQRWASLGQGIGSTGRTRALTPYAGGLLFGGRTAVGGLPHRFILRWGCPDGPPANPVDIDGNGRVNIDDLLMLISAWGPCPSPCAADIDGDGVVNAIDLTLLLAGWG